MSAAPFLLAALAAGILSWRRSQHAPILAAFLCSSVLALTPDNAPARHQMAIIFTGQCACLWAYVEAWGGDDRRELRAFVAVLLVAGCSGVLWAPHAVLWWRALWRMALFFSAAFGAVLFALSRRARSATDIVCLLLLAEDLLFAALISWAPDALRPLAMVQALACTAVQAVAIGWRMRRE